MVCNGRQSGPEVYNVGRNGAPTLFIVKTIGEQLHDRLKDDGISEDLVNTSLTVWAMTAAMASTPPRSKNSGWYPETPASRRASS